MSSSATSAEASATRKRKGAPVSSTTDASKKERHGDESPVLWWPSTESPLHVPLAVEEDMRKVILRWGAKERGMLRDQPPFRLREIQQRCERHGFHLSQACSLRRHHLQQLNPYKTKEALQLGRTKDIQDAAELFERAIGRFLKKQSVAYYTEAQQKRHFQRTNPPNALQPGTPDFKFQTPTVLQVHSHDDRTKIHVQRTVHWLEAKMFYGASTIPSDGKSAVGQILPKMKKYVQLYGEGAVVFSQGCGDQLAQALADSGVTALSCFSDQFDFSALTAHLETWCADDRGQILP